MGLSLGLFTGIIGLFTCILRSVYLQLDARQPHAPRHAQGLRRARQGDAPGTVHAACSIRIRQHTMHVAYAYVSIRQEGAPGTVHAACRLKLSIWAYLVYAHTS